MKPITFKPVATIGDQVRVMNYRLRPERWVNGIVRQVAFTQRFSPDFYESYEVEVKGSKGKYNVTVGRGKIKLKPLK